MRLCLVFLAALFTPGLASSPYRTDNENFGILIDNLLAVAKSFSTCKTAESVLSVRDALVNKQEVVQQRYEATEKLIKTSIDGVREDFVSRLNQEMETLNAQLLNLRKGNEARDESVEKLQSTATELANKVKDLDAKISSVQGKLKNTTSKGGLGCPSPYMSVNSDCLYIHHHSIVNWDDARSFCRQIGGDLAVPKDVIKLGEFLNKYGSRYNLWVGATDSAKEGLFLWLTGTKVDLSTGWAYGEPNDDFGQDCVAYAASDKLLYDLGCSYKYSFICQANRL